MTISHYENCGKCHGVGPCGADDCPLGKPLEPTGGIGWSPDYKSDPLPQEVLLPQPQVKHVTGTDEEHVCNEHCGVDPRKPHYYPDWEAADAAWRKLNPPTPDLTGEIQQKRVVWKNGYVQCYNDHVLEFRTKYEELVARIKRGIIETEDASSSSDALQDLMATLQEGDDIKWEDEE